MSTYYRTTDGARLEISDTDFACLVDNGKASILRLFSVDPQPTPTASQYVQPGPIVCDDTTARATWVLVDKPTEVVARELDVEQIKAVLTALKNGTGTAAERLTRLERVVFRLAKDALS